MSDMNPSPEFEEKVRKAMEVSGADPEFVNRLKNELARRPVKMKPRFVLKPAWAIALAVVVVALIASAPVAVDALKKLFGYVPGVGLVENSNGMRALLEPVSVTKDGVTLTVTQALVYDNYIQLVYEFSGVAPENNSSTFSMEEMNTIDQSAFCGGQTTPPFTDSDARLRLPDGTMVNRAFDTQKYPENIFATKPAFEVALPADVMDITMVLKCIPWTRLDAVPEDWEVPLKLQIVPAGTVIGDPVLEVTPSSASSVTDAGFTVSLEKVVPQNDFYNFYFTIVPEQPNNAVQAYFPASAYLTDATGQKVSMIYMHPFSGSHDVAEPWELQTVAKPAYGPYTLVLEKIFTYYDEDGSNFFEVDLGAAPQVGQTWEINQTLHLAGADVRVVSATVVERDLTMWGGTANTQGLEFTFESADGKTPFMLDIMDNDPAHMINGSIFPINTDGTSEPSLKNTFGLFYEKGVPSGKLSVSVNGESVKTEGHWEFQWTSPDQTGEELLNALEPISSAAGASGVTSELHRVVKTKDGYLFFIHMTNPEQNPEFELVEPVEVSVVDSTGKKIKLTLDSPEYYAATNDTLLQYSTDEEIASGPLKLTIEKAKVRYTPFNFDTPPAQDVFKEAIQAHSFIFDAGDDPQYGQTWTMDQEFEVGGYKGVVKMIQAVKFDPQESFFPGLRSDPSLNSGYEITVESLDPAIQWNVNFFISKSEDESGYADCIGYKDGEAGTTTTHTVSCRELATGKLTVSFDEILVLLNETWEVNLSIP